MMNPSLPRRPLWHLLQVSDVLDLELASALAEDVPLIAWKPQRTFRALTISAGFESETQAPRSPLRLRSLPLLPGFHRFPISIRSRISPSVIDRLLSQTPEPQLSPLICTVPYFAEVAEHWPGPVIYWLTDLIAEYAGADRNEVQELDRRLCRAATLVCPNSRRLRQYLIDAAGCDPATIEIVPNATREANVFPQPPLNSAANHPALRHVPRPIAGVIGNLASNMDWILMERTILGLPQFSWVFVGPASMKIAEESQRNARKRVLEHPRAHFLGARPYGELADFARSFDVAVLFYKRCEPTYSGSSTRFYEHLAACRPMIATAGLEELVHKQPLVHLIDSAEDGVRALQILRERNFDDGYLNLRWQSSQQTTWRHRAQTIQRALSKRLTPPLQSSSGHVAVTAVKSTSLGAGSAELHTPLK